MNATTYGLDVAKRLFQMYWVDAETGEIVMRRHSSQGASLRHSSVWFLARTEPAARST
jgi:hypothetical protein